MLFHVLTISDGTGLLSRAVRTVSLAQKAILGASGLIKYALIDTNCINTLLNMGLIGVFLSDLLITNKMLYLYANDPFQSQLPTLFLTEVGTHPAMDAAEASC